MAEKLRKHGVKILVFIINILLAAIAVFIIREREQAKLLEKAQSEKENPGSESVKNDISSSFENSVNIGEQGDPIGPENNSKQSDVSAKTPPPAKPIPATPVPSPTQKTKPSNAKTKTS